MAPRPALGGRVPSGGVSADGMSKLTASGISPVRVSTAPSRQLWRPGMTRWLRHPAPTRSQPATGVVSRMDSPLLEHLGEVRDCARSPGNPRQLRNPR